MGRKGKWFGAVKKVFSPESKEKKSLNTDKSKKWGFGKSKQSDPSPSEFVENIAPNSTPAPPTPLPPPPPPHPQEVKQAEGESEQSKHVYSVAIATATASEAAVASPQAAAEVVRLTNNGRFAGKSREETAAVKIQTAFRGYLARRALRALRGLVRLKSLIHGNSVKRQATTTLRCMQTLARVQSQIRSRRIRMSEDNQALQHQLLLKREKELENLRMGDEWDDSIQSKEQIVASLMSKQDAAIRRERALAYAFSHQWKNSSKSATPMFMDPNNPHWGWSWLERWMAARPWESRSTTDRDLNSDRASVKSAGHSIIGGEITKSYARRDTNLDHASPMNQKSIRPSSRHSPSTPQSKPTTFLAGKIKSASPRSGRVASEDDTRSMISMQSERPRRHSIAGSSVRDDESLASSPAVPSYMAPTESMRQKTRFNSPSTENIEVTTKGSIGTAKKRLSYPASPAVVRRHSGPPKVDVASMKDVAINLEENVSNGGSR